MKSDSFTHVRIPGVKKTTSIMSKKDKDTPERGTPRPARPDRGGGHPGRPDRGFENDLPGEPIVPDRDDAEMPGEIIVPDRGDIIVPDRTRRKV
jgi:hypothetical protein